MTGRIKRLIMDNPKYFAWWFFSAITEMME